MAVERMVRRAGGFTLIEMIMVMVITGIIAGIVASIMKLPIDSYVDTVRRAELTDTADTSLRRMARELRGALPNSLRQSGNQCIEFIPAIGGGRYRVAAGSSTDVLDFTQADSSFDVLRGDNLPPAGGFSAAIYHVVIYNLGIPGADAYDAPASKKNRVQIDGTASTGSKVTLVSSNQFPFESQYKRFQVIPNYSVIYACDGGFLYRTTAALSATKAASCPTSGRILAANVGSCNFTYASGVTAYSGLLSMRMTLTKGGESVNLYEEVHVDNVP